MILLIRHGESLANAGSIVDNHITIPLTEKGYQQAYKVSLEINTKPDLIITSAYTRARETAKYTIEKYNDTKIEIWPVQEFAYLNPACYLGKHIEDIKEKVTDYWNILDPLYQDGENAESFVMVLKRASFVYQKLLTLTDKTVVVFSHAQFIKVLLLLRDDHKCNPIEMMAKFTQLPHIENCEIVKYL